MPHISAANWQYRLDGVASRRRGAQDRFRTGRHAPCICRTISWPLPLTLQVEIPPPLADRSLSEMTSRSADFDIRASSDVSETKYMHRLPPCRSGLFVLCRQICLTSVNATSAAVVSVTVSSRAWLSGAGVLVLLAVWLAHVYVRREFESRSRHKVCPRCLVALLWCAALRHSIIE